MGFLSFLKYSFCDIWYKVRECKWRFILCIAISLIGFALGITVFCLSQYGWWYYNRCVFASKLMDAGFNVFISCLTVTALIYLLYLLCNMTRFTHYLVYIINLGACFYCGATVAALFVYSVSWAIMYVLFVAIEWLAVMCFACFVCVCEKPYCRTFCESARDSKQLLFVLIVGLIYKIIALFIILRLLTALI